MRTFDICEQHFAGSCPCNLGSELHLSVHPCSCRDCLCPAILTRGADQMPVSTKFDMRDDPNVVRNYGRMLVELASVIPDGIVAFFVSYSYMDTIVSKWDQMGVLQVSVFILYGLFAKHQYQM